MQGLPRHLKKLEKELSALGEDAMSMPEIDGFIAGLLVSPELILPGEWLPLIWTAETDNAYAAFADLAHVNRVFGLIMEQYNSVVVTLMQHPEHYQPLFPLDSSSGEVLWEVWIDGFLTAVALRPEGWQRLLDADAETASAMRGLRHLLDLVRDDVLLPEDHVIHQTAPDDIARWVVTLHEWRLANDQPPQVMDIGTPSAPGSKVGRNDPCPCGSGKKYKRCCGLN